MPAMQGAPSRRNAVFLPGPKPSRKAPQRFRGRTAVALCATALLASTAALAGCEYTYDEGWRPPDAVPAPATTDRSVQSNALRNEPVSEAELADWVDDELLYTGRTSIHLGFGILAGGQVKTDTAAGLPAGTYSLALVCRSHRRVAFTVSSTEYTQVDLSLRCGFIRENVIYLSKESALSFRVESRSLANYAYRLSRLGS